MSSIDKELGTFATSTFPENVIYRPEIDPIEAFQLDYGQFPIELDRPPIPSRDNPCSCVQHLQYKTGDARIFGWGTARNIPVESTTPFPHGFAVTYESGYGHLLEYVLEWNQLHVIDEANYEHCAVTSGRMIPVGDPRIKGYLPL